MVLDRIGRALRAPRLAALATGVLALTLAAPDADAQLGRGTKPAFEFSRELVQGDGATSLADMQGKLLWVEFWGTY